MALIGTIRKNFWFVLILLGFALVAFILMDIMGSSQRSAGTSPTIGKIEDTSIKYQDFQTTKSVLYSNSAADQGAIDNAVWSYYTEKAIVQNEADKLGMAVSKDELMELQFGTNLSPIIRQNFGDPQTGQINRTNLMSFKTAMEEGTFDNARMRLFWSEQEKQIKKTALQDKLNAIVAKGLYTPTWMVEENFRDNNIDVDVAFVNVPFTAMGDDEVDVTDAAISSYLKSNQAKYMVDEETRTAEYIVFNVEASQTDSTFWKGEAATIKTGLAAAANDSIYAATNQGSYNNYYYAKSELPATVADAISGMNVGDTYGPYLETGAYNSFKISDTQVVPDSVKASHILRSVDLAIPGQLEAANTLIDSLKRELMSGRAKFSDVATANSQDPGSAAKGGELGYFAQGAMVPGFKDACFYYGEEGGYYKVQTQFGVHLIYIADRKFLNRDPKYKIAFVRTPIIPTEATVSAVDQRVADLVSENKTLDALRAAIDGQSDLKVESSQAFKASDYTFGPLGGGNVSRDIIKWLFDDSNAAGDVSPEIYSYQDKALYYYNKFVAVGLKEITPKGLPSVASSRSNVEAQVRNQLKGEALKAKISGTDLNAIASQYNANVDTLKNLTFGAATGSKLGNEPKVIAVAHAQEANATSSPVVGDAGVYIVKTLAKYAAPEATNVPQLRKTQSQSARSQVAFRLMDALKKSSDIKDTRSAVNM